MTLVTMGYHMTMLLQLSIMSCVISHNQFISLCVCVVTVLGAWFTAATIHKIETVHLGSGMRTARDTHKLHEQVSQPPVHSPLLGVPFSQFSLDSLRSTDDGEGKRLNLIQDYLAWYTDMSWKWIAAALHPNSGMALKDCHEEKSSHCAELQVVYLVIQFLWEEK